MANNYCGKSCDQCPKYVDTSCVGCHGGNYSKDCPIVKCCEDHGNDFCGTCVNATDCMTRKLREQMPELLLDMQHRDTAFRSRRQQNAQKLSAWLWPIFWLMIAQTVVSLLNNDVVTAILPVMEKIAPILMGIFAAAVGICYLMLREVDPRYQAVGIIQLVVAAYDLIADRFLKGPVLASVALVAVLVLTVYCKYSQCMAHAEVLHGLHDWLEEKWVSQWNWHKIIYISFPVVLLLLLIPLINMLAMIALVALVGLLIFVTIRDYVYLYQMATFFRDYPGE